MFSSLPEVLDLKLSEGEDLFSGKQHFGAFDLDVGTLAFRQLMGFPY